MGVRPAWLLRSLQCHMHACGRHHFMDTCDSKRDCARMCREKAFVGVC